MEMILYSSWIMIWTKLRYMSYPEGTPTYVPKQKFIKYVDCYTEHFVIKPRYCTCVESVAYDGQTNRWMVIACDMVVGTETLYTVKFLVVATGENAVESIPAIPGFHSFHGEAIHSSAYKSRSSYAGQRVLVVGSGNSRMEIAYDLASHDADTSIVVRSSVHIMTKELIRLGMILVKYIPVTVVDSLIVNSANFVFGDLSGHGIVRPKLGPLLLKSKTGRSCVIDVGTVRLIKNGVIKVFGGISKIVGNKVSSFDAIVFATGYRSTANLWVKCMLNSDGFPKNGGPNHWKGDSGVYCAGFARRGLAGISMDAMSIANDIISTEYPFAPLSTDHVY
ncbi:hypothetical protein U9M48_003950 [Paspalum notatum var. saurae]|uniref:Flavin-containing monooxygenase n=1 Tax=Paspalum notatum var. saurae TaxID=547442 RepID=A0AAQ3SIL3_PASNO